MIYVTCRGDKKEGIYTCPAEVPLSAKDVKKFANLEGKHIISLGCETVEPVLANSFLKAGAEIFIAPTGAPYGNSAFVFGVHVAYQLAQNKKSLKDAFTTAQSFDTQSEMFKLFGK